MLPWGVIPDVIHQGNTVNEELRTLTRNVSVAVLEAINRRRALTQLELWFSPSVIHQIRAFALAHGAIPFRLFSIHVQRPNFHTLEIADHIRQGSRSAVVTMRLNQEELGWQCAHFDITSNLPTANLRPVYAAGPELRPSRESPSTRRAVERPANR
ncbi:MAG: Rv3235 family protein [Propionibacteriaceae bacterium]|nr:Rv3235 family protein [Propionibacteriaceae bacterium]